ncbi:hypothetical protein ANN_11646 [Periplaneta americana]|uniref:Uncharacterized protein n=1 Tax=Periplaneta americana TaxID=6978 RepID=A0ABQ8T6B1_PERAM|nr:hypothetical protein ANN_11646 [Periplaneta americana]
MAGLCEGGNEPPGSLKATVILHPKKSSSFTNLYPQQLLQRGDVIILRVMLLELNDSYEQYRIKMNVNKKETMNNFKGKKRWYVQPEVPGSIPGLGTIFPLKLFKSASQGALPERLDLQKETLVIGRKVNKNQSDSLMAADGDCHHLCKFCKLIAPVRHRWSINDVIGGIRNTVMPSDCSPVRFGIRSTCEQTTTVDATIHVQWSARSPDLSPLDFFLWGTVKDSV